MIELFCLFGPDLIEDDSHGDGQHSAQYNEYQVVRQGVAGDDPSVLGVKQKLEVVKSNIGAVVDSCGEMIALKCQYDTRHGDIVVDDEV